MGALPPTPDPLPFFLAYTSFIPAGYAPVCIKKMIYQFIYHLTSFKSNTTVSSRAKLIIFLVKMSSFTELLFPLQ